MIVVAHIITGLGTGGAEAMLAKLVGLSDRKKFRHVIVSLTDLGAQGAILRSSGVTVSALGISRMVPNPLAFLRLVQWLNQHRPMIIQSWLYHADLAATLAAPAVDAALVWNIRCSDMQMTRYGLISGFVPHVLALLSAYPIAVVVNSRAGLEHHVKIGYRPRRWLHIPNGFDTSRFAPNFEARVSIRSELAIDERSKVITFPARFDPMKDHETFFAAVARFSQPDVVFILVGAGMNRDSSARLSQMTQDLNECSKVRFLGERHDLERIYAASDLVTLCSAFGEGFPNVLGEAMASGIPCVATDVGDCAEIIGDTGFVVPPRDPEALAAAWKTVLQYEPRTRAALGLSARRRIEQCYDLADVVRAYEELYISLVD